MNRAALFRWIGPALWLAAAAAPQGARADELRDDDGEDVPGLIRQGAWEGRCYREGFLQGRDRELCEVSLSPEGPVTGAMIERTAEGLTFEFYNGELRCADHLDDRRMPATEFAGPRRVARVVAFLDGAFEEAVQACGGPAQAPRIGRQDIAMLLSATDGLKPESFLLADAAARAPLAATCGTKLEQDWRELLRAHSIPENGQAVLMMYTFSENGWRRAEARFEAQPELMEAFFAMGIGPGGAMMSAQKPIEAWRDPPPAAFVALCDIAIDAWSSFVELGLNASSEVISPEFTVRASTGVAEQRGYWIGSTPPVLEPTADASSRTAQADLPDG